MTERELRRAIELPARHVGLQLEPGLTDVILADIGDEPGGLPLLSTALLETWVRRDDTTLTVAGYEDAGGVSGALTHLAESVYERFSPDEQSACRRILLRLAEPSEGDDDVRRRAPQPSSWHPTIAMPPRCSPRSPTGGSSPRVPTASRSPTRHCSGSGRAPAPGSRTIATAGASTIASRPARPAGRPRVGTRPSSTAAPASRPRSTGRRPTRAKPTGSSGTSSRRRAPRTMPSCAPPAAALVGCALLLAATAVLLVVAIAAGSLAVVQRGQARDRARAAEVGPPREPGRNPPRRPARPRAPPRRRGPPTRPVGHHRRRPSGGARQGAGRPRAPDLGPRRDRIRQRQPGRAAHRHRGQ